jgi:hypothetical protein
MSASVDAVTARGYGTLMTEHLFDEPGPFDNRPVRPCIQCKTTVTFDGQPGWTTCEACGVRQYLTVSSSLYPTGGQGRDGGRS